MLPVTVENPALVSVGNALVGSLGDDLDVLLVLDIVAIFLLDMDPQFVTLNESLHCERILVVSVANVPSEVLEIGSTVDQALGIAVENTGLAKQLHKDLIKLTERIHLRRFHQESWGCWGLSSQ